MTNNTAPFRRRGPTSASGAMSAGDGRGAIRAATVRMPAPACRPRAKWHAAPAPCANCPMLRRLVSEESTELGGVTTLGTHQLPFRERQVEISNVLPAESAQNRWISQPVARVLCELLCLHPRFSARGSRIPRSARSPRRVCRYWSCARRRQSNAGRGSRWRTSVCCSRAPSLLRPFLRR